MSVVNKIGNLFNRKSDAPQTDAGPASDQDLLVSDELKPYQADALNSVQGDPDSPVSEMPSAEADADLIALPVLGQATAAVHQRRLLMLLALGVVLLALIAGWVLQQADRTAQQLASTGQSLMQSQRLAKSVSQALVGSPQAFPDVVGKFGRVGAQRARTQTAVTTSWGCSPWVSPTSRNWRP